MRNIYDTPSVDRILAEQETEFPYGPLGVLRPPQVIVEPGLEREMQALKEWKAGRISLFDLMSRLEALQRQSLESPFLKL